MMVCAALSFHKCPSRWRRSQGADQLWPLCGSAVASHHSAEGSRGRPPVVRRPGARSVTRWTISHFGDWHSVLNGRPLVWDLPGESDKDFTTRLDCVPQR